MDKIGSSSSPQKGGLYRNLMMPGFTDAGAGAAYVPKAVIPRRTAATSKKASIASTMASSTAADIIDNDKHDVDDHAEENFSEAGTELHDNRTNKNSMARRDRYYQLKSSVIQDSGKSERGRDVNANANTTTNKSNNNCHNNDHANANANANNTSSDSIEVEATFGFFPSTKPPPSPSPRGIDGALVGGENRVDSNEKNAKSPNRISKYPSTSLSPSPYPISPPPVTRKQLVTVKSPAVVDDTPKNTTDGIPPELTARTESETSRKDKGRAEQDHAMKQNTQQQQPLHERPFAMQRSMKREVSTFSLAPETGAVVEREEHQAELKQWKEKGALNERQNNNNESKNKFQNFEHDTQKQPQRIDEIQESETDSGNDNDEACNDDKDISRRLDLNALQEIDRMENQTETKDLHPFGNSLYNENKTKTAKKVDEREDVLIDKNDTTNDHDNEGSQELSTSSSIISSTCSEFGTVIQMGDATLAARMKEVDDMQLAALAEASVEDYDTEHQTKASQLSSTSLLQHGNSLDLRILDLSSSGIKDAANIKPDGFEAELQPHKGEKIKFQQSDTETTAASANSATSPRKRNPTKSEMVSAAIRRIGPIHGLNNNTTMREDKTIRNSLSAPTTPMLIPPPNYSKQLPDVSAVGQDSSPSRYETASDIAGDKKTRILSPRFASFLRGRGNGGATTSSDPKNVPHPIPLSPRVAITQTFQYAQKCFSNDNTMAAYDANDYDRDVDVYDINERRRKLQEDLVIPPLGQRPTTTQLAPRVFPLESSSIRYSRRVGNSTGTLRYSHSLDSSSNRKSPFRKLSSSTSQRYPSMHHSFPVPTNEATTSSSIAIPNTSSNVNLRGRINSDFSPTKYSKKTMALNSTMKLQEPERIEIEREDALNILAILVEQGIAHWNTSTESQNVNPVSINLHNDDNKNTVGKASDLDKDCPNRVMITPSGVAPPPASIDIMKIAKEEKTEDNVSQMPPASKKNASLNNSMNSNPYDYDSALHELVGDFKKWIDDHDEERNLSCENGTNNRHNRQHRTEILQDLVKSHAYAVEMKRASASASAWLKSIGKGQGTSKHEILRNSEEIPEHKSTSISTDATEVESSKKNESNTTDKMDMLTLKARLHRAHLELTETKQFNSMLNEELSKCRAEIGRIKSVSRSDHINKSILDDSERSSDTSFSEARSKEFSANSITRSPGAGQPKGPSKEEPKYEHFFQGVPSQEARERIDSTGELDIIVLKNALNKANETIRRLHHDLRKNEGVEDEEETDPAPVVDIPEIQVKKTQPGSKTSTPDSTLRTVNVRMLDGENFVTDWDDLRTLPPPPDHSLQSPIVFAVLEQWTQDRSLHESLFSWIDNVMTGDDLEGLPPLTISSLDHQVRDGFTMHVLPHLLRRADIHVAVQTRTHRQTTYDMSVTVSQKKEFTMGSSKDPSSSTGYSQPHDNNSQQQPSLLDRRDSMSGDEWVNRFEPRLSSAESVAHSAVTEACANLPGTAQSQPGVIRDPWDQPPQTPVQTDYSEFPSQLRSRSGSADDFDESSQPYKQRQNEENPGSGSNGTIMGALGGALSGLLSRNKYAVSPGRFHSSHTRFRTTGSAEDSRSTSNMLPASLQAQIDLTSSPTPGSAGYHRVRQLEATVSAGIDEQRQHHQEEPQPYHRVVSAPPGRIGVTFVEFRGHAMVSDVAMDSPLAGWVFPSDILIAVDEIPVSGMRVRDIVTILSDRKNRQRAMRVISSHAMNEFTMMSQVGGPLNEEIGDDE